MPLKTKLNVKKCELANEITLFLQFSKYNDNFTLKGGIFLYALFDGNYARATTDIDLKAEKISNDLNFSSREHFCYFFKKETNETPLSYRKKQKMD